MLRADNRIRKEIRPALRTPIVSGPCDLIHDSSGDNMESHSTAPNAQEAAAKPGFALAPGVAGCGMHGRDAALVMALCLSRRAGTQSAAVLEIF